MDTPSRNTPLTPPDAHPYRAYIFDCDGTLAATMGLHYKAWLHAIRCQRTGPVDWDWATFCSMGGMSIEDTVVFLGKQLQFAFDIPRIIADTDAYLEQHLDTVQPCQDALALARSAAAQGIKLAIASGGHRWRVLRTLRAIGVEAMFPVVIASEDVTRVKPAPDLFLLAASRLGIPPTDCLVIEDSPKGREAAHAAGMNCLLVPPC